VQSTALYLMYHRGEITPQIDYAIFADTQDEPEQVMGPGHVTSIRMRGSRRRSTK
jgi:hypothetical protein